MWTRDQIHTVLTLRNKNTLFSKLPLDIIQEISQYGQDPNSILATALNHAADARQESVDALLALLEDNPHLLLQAGNVKNRGGNVYTRVTIYEFLLGEGDDDFAKQVGEYFSRIDDGEQERRRQYERYQPHIEGMLIQKPYDLSPLVELIKKTKLEEIQTLLKKDMTDVNAELCEAILQFRKDWAPQVFHKPCMHYNYPSLQHALDLLKSEWNNLSETSEDDLSGASEDDYDYMLARIDLVWKQLIGFEMRRLPGIDRCILAQGLNSLITKKEPLVRSYGYKGIDNDDEFPMTDCDDSLDGLGGDFSIDMEFGCGDCWLLASDDWQMRSAVLFDNLCRTKNSNLHNLGSSTQFTIQVSG